MLLLQTTYYMSRWKSLLILFWFWNVGIIILFLIIENNIFSVLQKEFEKNIFLWLIITGCIIFLLWLFVFVPLYTFFTSHKIPVAHIYDDGIRVRTEPWRRSFPITLWDMKQDPNGIFVSYHEIHSIKQHRGFTSVYLKPVWWFGVPKPLFASWWMLSKNDRNEVFEIIDWKMKENTIS